MSALVPSGAIGVLLKSNWPCNSSYAVLFGFCRDVRSMLSVICACGRNSSHSWIGKSMSTVASPAMKWCLKVWMALSAALT